MIRPPKSEARKRVGEDAPVSFLPMEHLGIGQRETTPTVERLLGSVVGSYTYFAEGDILLAKITPCFENGKLGIARKLTNGVGFGSSEYFVIRPSDKVMPEWLYFFLDNDAFRAAGAARMTGAVGHKRVPPDFIEDSKLPLPSIAEQRRIVGILDEAFAGLEAMRANALANELQAKALFDKELDAIVRGASVQFGSTALENLADDITDGDHMPPPKASSGVPFITIGNIEKQSRQIDFSDTFLVPRTYYDALKSSKRPKRGDVLYTVTGSFGIPVLVNGEREFCFQRHIGLIRPKQNTIGAWLRYVLLSKSVFQQASDRATGTAQKTVSLKVLRSLLVPNVPAAKQFAFVERLDSISAEISALRLNYEAKAEKLGELRQSLLHQAFSGNL